MSADRIVIDGDLSVVLDCFGDWGVSIPADSMKFETGIHKPTGYLTTANVSFKLPHSEPPAVVILADASGENRYQNACLAWVFVDFAKLTGAPIVATSGSGQYATINGAYKSSVAAIGWVRQNVSTENSAKVTAEGFTAEVAVNGAITRWQAGVSYKWIAIWR